MHRTGTLYVKVRDGAAQAGNPATGGRAPGGRRGVVGAYDDSVRAPTNPTRGDVLRRHIVTIYGTLPPTGISASPPLAPCSILAGMALERARSASETRPAIPGTLGSTSASPYPAPSCRGDRLGMVPAPILSDTNEGAGQMNNQEQRKARMAASRAIAYTFGPYAVTCTIRNPQSGVIVGYGIGKDQASATIKALDTLRPLA